MSFAHVDQFEVAALKAPATGAQQPQQQDVANAAHILVSQFATPESTQNRTRAIWDMATHLDVGRFTTAMDNALKQAAANDKASGWQPAPDATGRAKYGPSQSTLATVASQCRQVFGACKIDPECIVSLPQSGIVQPDLFPNWSTAYNRAKEFLTKKGVDWTGNSLSAVKQAKQNKKETGENADILAEVMAAHPKAMGESMADYMARIADDVDAVAQDRAEKALQDNAKKELTRLIKVYGDGVADILEAMVTAHNAMADAEPASY